MSYTPDEVMTVAAARELTDRTVCFVGIGLPSTAANLARLTHAPRTVLVYESGTIGSKPATLPLSIGDGELAETADAVVPVPEIFNYWLQGGRIDVGFLGAAQIDRHGNLNSTVIGDYDRPTVRLPGGGGAPEIARSCRHVFVMLRQGRRELELIRMTPDVLYDQLIGMGAARKLVFSYGGNPGVGSLHRFYRRWDAISRDRDAFRAWMEENVGASREHVA